MELIKSAARRSLVSEIIYIVLNIVFAGIVCVLAALFDPPYAAYILVLLSKWRVFAVRPRFWFANVQANTVDVVVGFSAVTLIWQSREVLGAQILLGVLYMVWLLVLKPRARRKWILLQASISQFIGLTALLSLTYEAPSIIATLTAWLIGYVAARHALGSFDEEELTLMSLAWGLVVAELAWLSYHWTIAYQLGQLMVPQLAIIVTLMSFIGIKLYAMHRHEDKIRLSELKWPLIFAALVLGMLLFGFTGLDLSPLL